MTIDQVIKKAYLLSNGKATVLSAPRYTKFMALANLLKDDWLQEPGIQWNSRYARVSLGNITGDRVDLDESIYEFSKREGDYITIQTPNTDSYSYFTYVSPNQFGFNNHEGMNVCTVMDGSLVFPKTYVETDPQYGGLVVAPVTLNFDDYIRGTDEVLIDNPNWLAYMMAAEQVRNTVTKLSQYGTLIDRANNLMMKMKEANDSQYDEIALYPSTLGESWDQGDSYGLVR